MPIKMTLVASLALAAMMTACGTKSSQASNVKEAALSRSTSVTLSDSDAKDFFLLLVRTHVKMDYIPPPFSTGPSHYFYAVDSIDCSLGYMCKSTSTEGEHFIFGLDAKGLLQYIDAVGQQYGVSSLRSISDISLSYTPANPLYNVSEAYTASFSF